MTTFKAMKTLLDIPALQTSSKDKCIIILSALLIHLFVCYFCHVGQLAHCYDGWHLHQNCRNQKWMDETGEVQMIAEG